MAWFPRRCALAAFLSTRRISTVALSCSAVCVLFSRSVADDTDRWTPRREAAPCRRTSPRVLRTRARRGAERESRLS